jgi:[ribosomal protein S5]-alanine N-acetyltransferase
MYPVAITGHLVILRELTGSDSAGLHKVYGNDEATRHLSFEPRSMEQIAAIISAAIRSATADPRTGYMLAVADKDEELIGAARLATGEYENATTGFALRPDRWGHLSTHG